MKILLVNTMFGPFGGAEEFTLSLYNLLAEKGHDVDVFATNKTPYYNINKELKTEFFPEYTNYSNLNGFNKIFLNLVRRNYNFEAKAKFDKFLRLVKPDIIHFQMPLAFSLFDALKEHSNIPIVHTLHGPLYFCPTVLTRNPRNYCKEEHCVSGNYIHCIKNKCQGNSYLKSSNAAMRVFIQRRLASHKKINQFTTPSADLKRLAVNAGIPGEKITVIPNFADKECFNNEPNYSNKGYFLYAGRLSLEKGVDYLIKAFSELPPEIKLRIVGTGPEEAHLKQQAKNLSNVEFVGFKPRNELVKEYDNCIASLLTCNWFENCPISVIDSLCFGKPVIASKVGGLPELVENNKTGYLVETGDIQQIKDSIIKLYENPQLAIEMGQKAREKAETQYTKEVFYNGLIEVYEKAMAKF